MEFSQDEVVECSQRSCRSAKRSAGRARKLYTQPKAKLRSSQKHRSSGGTAGGLEIPESSTEETWANVSGSLFTGQQDLLKQYDEHEQRQLGNHRDEVLERVLEQSRKAYEQLKLQTESRELFSEDVVCPARKEIGVNTEGIGTSEAGVQVSQNVAAVISKDFGAQVRFSKPDQVDVGVQLSPSVSKRRTRDAEIQLSPQQVKMIKTDAGVNTDPALREDASVQTTKVEKRNVGVQKYHSTRVREMAVQTSVGELNRSAGKRNVCVQQRSSGMLELNREVAQVLGIELKCDPTRLQRLLMRVAAKQCSTNAEESSVQRSTTVDAEFTDEDPYWANYGYFMNDVGTDDGSASDSGLGDIEPRMSCYVEESLG